MSRFQRIYDCGLYVLPPAGAIIGMVKEAQMCYREKISYKRAMAETATSTTIGFFFGLLAGASWPIVIPIATASALVTSPNYFMNRNKTAIDKQ